MFGNGKQSKCKNLSFQTLALGCEDLYLFIAILRTQGDVALVGRMIFIINMQLSTNKNI